MITRNYENTPSSALFWSTNPSILDIGGLVWTPLFAFQINRELYYRCLYLRIKLNIILALCDFDEV